MSPSVADLDRFMADWSKHNQPSSDIVILDEDMTVVRSSDPSLVGQQVDADGPDDTEGIRAWAADQALRQGDVAGDHIGTSDLAGADNFTVAGKGAFFVDGNRCLYPRVIIPRVYFRSTVGKILLIANSLNLRMSLWLFIFWLIPPLYMSSLSRFQQLPSDRLKRLWLALALCINAIAVPLFILWTSSSAKRVSTGTTVDRYR